MFHFILLFCCFHAILCISLSEETQLGNAFLAEDEPGYLYMDTRANKNKETGETEIEARRRSTMARNFVRLGRRDMLLPLQEGVDSDYDEFDDEFERNNRAGEKSDHFIRFGRGHSDFVRFGRNSTPVRHPSSYFRLGRSVEEVKRSKRNAYQQKEKKNSNFVRFGRTHNFMRFGRNPQNIEETNENMKDMQEAKLLRLLLQLSQGSQL